MKTALDPRHTRREKLVTELFQLDFHKQRVSQNALAIFSKKAALDRYIQKAAPEFTVDKINKADLAVLRLAVFELMFAKKEPPKVIIDEAIELAKEFGGDTSPAFINGALGNIVPYDPSTRTQDHTERSRMYDKPSKDK